MQKFKHKLKAAGASLALAATLVGGAATLSTSAAAQQPTNMGNALTFPYYTVMEGWETFFNVTNVTDKALAIKVRLHEAQNSRDILDFIVLLSPKDVWSAKLAWADDAIGGEQAGVGGVLLSTNDTSCTVPMAVQDGAYTNELAYTGDFADGGMNSSDMDGSLDRLREGYIEVLLMGEADDLANALVAATIHTAGVPSCVGVDAGFSSTNAAWDEVSVPGTGEPTAALAAYVAITETAALRGAVSYVNSGRGLAAGSEALAIPDYGVGAQLITAQQYPYFLEPTLASLGMVWTHDYTLAEAYINAWGITNEWSTNATTGAQSDWVVTFPTKRGHVDVAPTYATDNIQAGCNRWRNDGSAVAADLTHCVLAPFETLFSTAGSSKITVGYDIFDREEGMVSVVTDGVTISPAPPIEVTIDSFNYEANVLVVGNSDDGDLTSIFSSGIAKMVDTTILGNGAKNGVLEVRFTEAGGAGTAGMLPVTGFVLKSRDLGDATKAFGQLMKHSILAP